MNYKETLLYKLKEYTKKDLYPMYMPGHKRNIPDEIGKKLQDMYSIDITEVCGTDNLYEAKDIIKDALDYAKNVYKSDASYFLVNGSTCGILSAIKTVAKRKDKILFATNAHYSAYQAVELLGIEPVYLNVKKVKEYDIFASVDVDEIKKALKDDEIKAIYLTSPTYDGVVSDVFAVAKLAHSKNIPLIVDSAHGAHYTYMKDLGIKSPLSLGADIVIESLHKTLPAPTQTAIIHIKSELGSKENLLKNIKIFQTSSPSYIFMSAIDLCIRYCNEDAKDIIKVYLQNLKKLRQVKLSNLSIYTPTKDEVYDYDITKIIIASKKINGIALQKILRQSYGIETEMANTDYCLALSSFLDTKDGLEKLSNALIDIDKNFDNIQKDYKILKENIDDKKTKETIQYIETFKGKMYNDYIYIYPPGIPILKANDILTTDKLEEIKKYLINGYELIY